MSASRACRKTLYESLGQAEQGTQLRWVRAFNQIKDLGKHEKACSFQRQSLWSLSADSEIPFCLLKTQEWVNFQPFKG